MSAILRHKHGVSDMTTFQNLNTTRLVSISRIYVYSTYKIISKGCLFTYAMFENMDKSSKNNSVLSGEMFE